MAESKAAAKDTKADEPEVAEQAAPEPGIEIKVEGETNGATVTIDGEEFVLNAQETVALKTAVDAAVAGMTL
jgi:hypothetical protein